MLDATACAASAASELGIHSEWSKHGVHQRTWQRWFLLEIQGNSAYSLWGLCFYVRLQGFADLVCGVSVSGWENDCNC
jgi:hypothetical protein